ncbi:hypothetical protein [Maribacter polysiphoniae]
MFAYPDVGFAMENAHPNIKKTVDFSPLSNQEQNIGHIVLQLVTY